MKVTITDSQALGTLRPLDLIGYLRTHEWSQVSKIERRGSIWTGGPGDSYEVLVPLDVDLGDFSHRVADVLMTLSTVEKRSQAEIFHDISSTSDDLVRFRAQGADTNGTIQVDEGVSLVERARDIMLAAACAATGPKAVFQSRKPARAVKYMKNVRLGQTEVGSFVVALHSPVTPALQQVLPETEPGDDLFERTVTKTLARSLVALSDAAQSAATTGEFKPFEDAKSIGVSANLCEAVTGFYDATKAKELSVRLSWAPVRPIDEPDVPTCVVIPSDMAPVIKEASGLFRKSNPEKDAQVRGYVVRLEREEGQATGFATIFGSTDAGYRKIRFELMGTDYDVAINAHRDGLPLKVIGELRKERRGYQLHGVRAIEVDDTADDESADDER